MVAKTKNNLIFVEQNLEIQSRHKNGEALNEVNI